jgi:carbonic anhydrase/acetyltransferase-like protein (isoleucine patch superfamily)
MNQFTSALAKAIRQSGQALDAVGRSFEVCAVVETLQPATAVVKLGLSVPTVKNVVICPTASVVGRVSIGAKSSIWYGAVVRGDVNTISIGEGVTIGDRCMIHCTGAPADFPTQIGDNVVVSSGSIIHGSTIGNNCFIGEGSQLLDGVKMGEGSMVAAGSFVSAGKEIPAGQLWSGIPARYERDLIPEEIIKIAEYALENVKLATLHAEEHAKTWQTIEQEKFDYFQESGRADYYYQRLTKDQWSERLGEIEGHMIPGRILDSGVSTRSMPRAMSDWEETMVKELDEAKNREEIPKR